MEQKCRIKGKLPKLLMLLCMFLCSFTMAFAQKTVKGTVLDETGSSVIGANVLEKGTTNGTITDMDGNFTLKVKNDAVLVVSFIGYKDQTIPVKGKTEFKITLKEDSGLLDEVVVVGYGVQKKVNLTGAVSTVSAESWRAVLQQACPVHCPVWPQVYRSTRDRESPAAMEPASRCAVSAVSTALLPWSSWTGQKPLWHL